MSTTDRRRFYLALGAFAALAFAIRLAYVIAHDQNVGEFSDAFYYHSGANLLVDGHGFVDPIYYAVTGRSIPGVGHPPGFQVALAVASLFGAKSFFAHQVWAAMLSTGTVVVVGLAGRRVAGPRTGLIAAGIAALYPEFFFSDGLLLSETLVLLMSAVTLLCAYRFWDRPTLGRAAALGAVCGVTALTRSETVLLIPLLVLPLALMVPGRAWRKRVALIAVATGCTVAVLAPWSVYNTRRLEHPTLLSSPDATLLNGNCNDVYYGGLVGYWSIGCLLKGGGTPGSSPRDGLTAQLEAVDGDVSVLGQEYRRQAFENMRNHLRRLPYVIYAREGRTFGFYRVAQQIDLDANSPREPALSYIAFGIHYLLVIAMVGGLIVLRKRRRPILPIVALIASVVLSVSITVGDTRYRAFADVPIVVAAAVGIDALYRPDRRDRAARVDDSTDDEIVSTAPPLA